MSIGAIRAGRAYVELLMHDAALQQGLMRAQARLRAFSAAVGTVGRSLLMVSTMAAVPLALSVRTFSRFNDAMRTVQAVTGATGDTFHRLTEQAKELGRTTSFAARQVAEGMISLGRAGFKPNEIQAAIPGVLDLARATGTELGQAAKYAGAVLRAFQLDASEADRVADVLAGTANMSAQTLEDLGESMKMVAPIAAQTGADIEWTIACAPVVLGIEPSFPTPFGTAYENG